MAVDTMTRADMVGRHVELEALSLLIAGIAETSEFEPLSGAVDWGNLLVGDGRNQPDLITLFGQLWPEDEDIETPEFYAAAARSAIAAASIAAWLASDDGRSAMSVFASNRARAAARHMQRAEGKLGRGF